MSRVSRPAAASPSTVNGDLLERDVEARRLLIHFIRDDLGLTGCHIGCDTGNCGACSVLLDGAPVRAACSSPWRPTARAIHDRRGARPATAS